MLDPAQERMRLKPKHYSIVRLRSGGHVSLSLP